MPWHSWHSEELSVLNLAPLPIYSDRSSLGETNRIPEPLLAMAEALSLHTCIAPYIQSVNLKMNPVSL